MKKKVAAKKLKTPIPTANDICFVIMPFGEWSDYYYDNIFEPAIQETKLSPRRVDDLYRPSAIVHDIWDFTRNAKLLLADLSGKNPNVFYELGLAHAIGKPVILIVEQMEDVPFDLRALRVIVYDKNDPNWGGILKEKIAAAIKEVLDSPAEAVLPTFLRVKGTSGPSVTPSEKDLISLRQDVDLLKREMQTRATIGYRPIRPPVPPSPSQLISKIQDYIQRGLPRDLIAQRLSEIYKIPQSLVIQLIDNVKAESVKTTPEPKEQEETEAKDKHRNGQQGHAADKQ